MVAYNFKKQFVCPIKIGLGTAVADSFGMPLPKRQTIRADGKRRHVRPGETIQLYSGMRTRQCFLIGTARCIRVRPITIWIGGIKKRPPRIAIQIEAEKVFDNQGLYPSRCNDFARSDGFQDAAEMAAFWLKNHGYGRFVGRIIEWEPI